MTVTPGYKQTEVGLIPEDWEVTKLRRVSKEPLQNGVFFRPSLKGKGVKLINVGDLYVDASINPETLALFDASEKDRQRYKVEDGDIFFTRSSVIPSGIAHCNIYRSTNDEVVVFDSHVIRFRPDKTKIDPLYIRKYCIGAIARRYFVSGAKTMAMTTIDQSALDKCPVILPPLGEQRAIAAALSDADDWIASLDRLIAKKRDIKQAAMQQLLTGRTRLPGFQKKNEYKKTEIGLIPIGWEVRPLAEISRKITDGEHLTPKREPQGFYLLSARNVLDGRIDVSDVDYVGLEEYVRIRRRCAPEADDILISCSGTIGRIALAPGHFECVLVRSAALVKLQKASSNPAFIHFWLRGETAQKQILSSVNQGAQPNLFLGQIEKILCPVPSLPEQQVVGAMLTDIETEIFDISPGPISTL